MFGRKSKVKEVVSPRELSAEERSALITEHDMLIDEMKTKCQNCPSCNAKIDFTGNKKRIWQIRNLLKMGPLNVDIYPLTSYKVLANRTTKLHVGKCAACGTCLAQMGKMKKWHVLNGPEKAVFYYAQNDGEDVNFGYPTFKRHIIDEFLWDETKELRARFEMEYKEIKARGFKVVKEDKSKAKEEDENV